MRIVCIKWGDKYGPEYVYRLKAMCERHIPHDDFMCMTEKPIPGVQCVPFNNEYPGWWSKVGLFRHGYFGGDVTMYLDLDIVITGPVPKLSELIRNDPEKLWAVDDFSYSLRKPRTDLRPDTQRLLGGVGTINSSVLLFDKRRAHKMLRQVYEDFDARVMADLHGDQNWITKRLGQQNIGLFPDGIVGSYKYGHGKPYPITVFHGEPKPHECEEAWIKQNWRDVVRMARYGSGTERRLAAANGGRLCDGA